MAPILQAVNDLSRRLKIKYCFRFAPNIQTKRLKTAKSNWVPDDKKVAPALLECIDNFTKEIENLQILKEKNNLPRDEFDALKRLSKKEDIIIKKSDKGSAIVIMDKQHYLAEGYRQLNNPLHYVKLSRPLYPQTATKFKEIITNLFTEHLLTDREFRFLLPPSDPRPRRFYMLPKTHKPKESWSFPNKMPPGRPIVSDCNSASKNISGLIDFYLKDLANRHLIWKTPRLFGFVCFW